MTTAAVQIAGTSRVSYGPWLWTPRIDLGLFLGSTLCALALVVVGSWTGLDEQPFPEWGWLLFVLAIDVAHVYATLFRTYLDPAELKRHPWRYALVPSLVFVMGYALYSQSELTFWRVFAYMAVYHFIRQQVGWVAIYRAKSRLKGSLDRWLDNAAVYMATLYPLLHWHAHLRQTEFAWFVQGDFIDVGEWAAIALPWFEVFWWCALTAFSIRQIVLLAVDRCLQLGKVVVVASTAAVWYVGIVLTNSDFAFTVTNVIVHGVPYFALLWAYTSARKREPGAGLWLGAATRGLTLFLLLLVCLAFAEELLWDQLVFHERAWLFGESAIELGPELLAFVVPLLMVPQATHYVLDGLLWRRKDSRVLPAQRRALGMLTNSSRRADDESR